MRWPALALLIALSPSGDRARVDALVAQAMALEAVHVKADQRVRAVDELVRMGARAAPYLVERLGTKRVHERIEVTGALKRIGRAATPYLTGALARGDERVRRVAASTLGGYVDPFARPALGRALTDPSARVREAAAYALGAQQDARDLPALIARVADPDEDPDVVREAQRGMRVVVQHARALVLPPGTTERLCERLATGTFAVRATAQELLADIGPAALPALERRLAAPPGPALWAAIATTGIILGEHPGARAGATGAAFCALLAHPDCTVRAQAIDGLALWGDEGKALALGVLAREGEPMVRQKILLLSARRAQPRSRAP